MVVGDAHVFPDFLTPVLTQLFFPKPPTTFLTCFCRSERRKYAGKKVHLNRGSNSQPPGHESDMLITKPPGRGRKHFEKRRVFSPFPIMFSKGCSFLRNFESCPTNMKVSNKCTASPFPPYILIVTH